MMKTLMKKIAHTMKRTNSPLFLFFKTEKIIVKRQFRKLTKRKNKEVS